MRRRLLIIAAFLLAGAVVNVAVAWGCVAHVAKQMGFGHVDPERQLGFWPPNTTYWDVELRTYGGYTLLTSAAWGLTWPAPKYLHSPYRPIKEWLPMWARCRKIHPDVSESYDGVLVENAAGWPFLAVRSSHRWRSCLRSGTFQTDQLSGVLRPSWLHRLHDDVALPYLPIWPGFAINSGLYAAPLWLLICGPFALRRVIRRRRGLCPKCAYPVGESAVCTECGKET